MGLSRRVSQAELRRLYEHERLTPAEIGARVGRSGRTVRVWLQQAGIALRPYRERPRRHRPPADTELRRCYDEEGLTAAQLAARYKVSASTARRWLRDAGIPRRVPGRRSRAPSGQELRQLYQDKGLSTTQIAQRYGVRQQTAHTWLRAAKIPLRPTGQPARANTATRHCTKRSSRRPRNADRHSSSSVPEHRYGLSTALVTEKESTGSADTHSRILRPSRSPVTCATCGEHSAQALVVPRLPGVGEEPGTTVRMAPPRGEWSGRAARCASRD
jgi:transposase